MCVCVCVCVCVCALLVYVCLQTFLMCICLCLNWLICANFPKKKKLRQTFLLDTWFQVFQCNSNNFENYLTLRIMAKRVLSALHGRSSSPDIL